MTLNKRNNAVVLEGKTLRPKSTRPATGEERSERFNRAGPNDASGQNPQGSSLADVTDCEKRTLSFMSTVHKIGTWNLGVYLKGNSKLYYVKCVEIMSRYWVSVRSDGRAWDTLHQGTIKYFSQGMHSPEPTVWGLLVLSQGHSQCSSWV